MKIFDGKNGHNKTFDPFLQTFKDIIKAFFAIYFPLFSQKVLFCHKNT